MMNINEYFNNLYSVTTTTDEWENISKYEESVCDVRENDEKAFKAWAEENNIDLTAVNPNTGITIVQHWAWDLDD